MEVTHPKPKTLDQHELGTDTSLAMDPKAASADVVAGSPHNGGEDLQGKGKEIPTVGAGAAAGGGGMSDLSENLERGFVIHGGGVEDQADGEEEEFDFGEEAEEDTVVQWLAIARFYSSRAVKAKVMFLELSNAWGDVRTHDLGDNKFLLEFLSENSRSFVLRGGPWNIKGDALIMVGYDGFTRLSEVEIESVNLWIRIYDVPVARLSNIYFVSALASKVGRVMEVAEAIRDFIRVRVDLALEDALKPKVQIKVKGRGVMEFMVKYEDVPHFFFWCGRIGHADRECPKDDLDANEMRFGVELRASSFRRAAGRQLAFYKALLAAKRGLNFSGSQRERVSSFSASSTPRGDIGCGQLARRVDRQRDKRLV